MAQYEKPVTEINFRQGEMPEVARPEEEFMYRYMKARPERQRKELASKRAEDGENDDDEEEDPELEKFVEQEMQKEMKRMAGGFDADEEDVLDDMEGMDEDGEDEDEIDMSDGDVQGDFFSGEEDL